jgi:hypothetical protein
MGDPILMAIAVILMFLFMWYVYVVANAFEKGLDKEEFELNFLIAKFTVSRTTLIIMFFSATPILFLLIIFILSAFSGEPMEDLAVYFIDRFIQNLR